MSPADEVEMACAEVLAMQAASAASQQTLPPLTVTLRFLRTFAASEKDFVLHTIEMYVQWVSRNLNE
eukprot:SAG31_NODE_372_length_16598_cov_44.705982_13_plen_67_part_00